MFVCYNYIGDDMKKVISLLVTLILLTVFFLNKDIISRFAFQKIIYRDAIVINSSNAYYKNSNFLLVQNTDNFIVKNKEQFLNIIYSVLNNGLEEFTFFCDYSYETCSEDFYDFIKNTNYAQTINNYVNPLNSYSNIDFSIDNLGKIKMIIYKNYTEEQITEINNIVDKFIKNNIYAALNDREKIRRFHDFLIENSIYDENYKLDMNKNSYPYHPYNAYGPLIEGLGICSGYSEAMAIFLDKIGVKNYRIASDEHIWNYIYLESNWYHLDLTWDDPVTSNGQQVILNDFFLITTEQLKNKNTNQHIYDENLYLETK